MTEQDLIGQAKSGDALAFERLVSPHLPGAYSTAALITRCYDAAQDAVQQGLIEAYRSIGRFRMGSSFRPWFMKLVVHRALDQGRALRRRVVVATEDVPEPVSREGDPEGQFLRAERRQAVWDAVQQLDPPHRAVVVLHYYQELSIAEIASVLEIAEGTVKSRLHTARRRIEEGTRNV